ncbi:MAG TPA: DHA2 family efflux MFS transporter permease subunit [Acidimicrobiales bacterium]|nr:DHA2 family efflux MFS transporter permease subunit [Acidimicrobiales bacterium]
MLGSGIAFLDGTVVNVALPAIGSDLDAGLSSLQWIVDGYLLTLGSLLLLGGSLGDLYGRRATFVAGLVAFTGASVLCGVAPSMRALVVARVLQGVGGALLVPGSLALLAATFEVEDRASAVGAWSGLAGVATAIGPFLGGWLVDAVSWRLIFLINLPLAAVAVAVTLRHVPESRDREAAHRPDVPGALTVTAGLGGVVFALIQWSEREGSAAVLLVGLTGAAALVAFPFLERRRRQPLVPLEIFRSGQFNGANATTLTVYAAFGGALFLLSLELQLVLGYSALATGAALLPITLLMLVLSARAARLGQRVGPRLPMTAGPVLIAAGLALLSGLRPGDTYVAGVLPGIVVVGLGLALTVAPLTAAVMAAVEDRHVGVGSGVNNAVARVGQLLSVAVLPLAAGLGGLAPSDPRYRDGVSRALLLSAGLCVVGAAVAWATVRRATPVVAVTQPSVTHACNDPCVRETAA